MPSQTQAVLNYLLSHGAGIVLFIYMDKLWFVDAFLKTWSPGLDPPAPGWLSTGPVSAHCLLAESLVCCGACATSHHVGFTPWEGAKREMRMFLLLRTLQNGAPCLLKLLWPELSQKTTPTAKKYSISLGSHAPS